MLCCRSSATNRENFKLKFELSNLTLARMSHEIAELSFCVLRIKRERI
jgi:hypothetical protein